ncbi:LysR family transcriptional regulator [Aneurinibacillus sp. Ricciae_BoGa-3]|uniref:LysR family transcriptional regulator n=1 Tax=Aneurinibacillus sp. Ricciae_BoGa-3 TaxID=3022697 RepID=UPI0023402D83|nr:LysR family transcriptional regulator [Aneurinibacillus sp. Ricciae_BoGa-3]WCK56505.1 LysR family transcriptional regulator [Aneurinibacillus sp. Ricciae_BoGa-3]
MDIRQLQYFIEVAKLNSFTKASESLHITQPNISRMVKNLEEELGIDLIDRSTKKLHLTEAGKIVFEEGQQIEQIIDRIAIKISDLMNVQKGKVQIGLPPIIGAKYFPQILAEFHACYPNINCELVEYGSKKVEQEVGAGNLDIGVVVLPVEEALYHSVPLVDEEVCLLVHRDHHFASRTNVYLHDLAHESFILFREDFTLHDRIIHECIQAGFQPTIIYESSQWDLIREMVATNLGVSLLPRTISEEVDPSIIKVIPIEPCIPWNISIIWRKGRYLSFAAREWIQFTCRYLNQICPLE